jgi:hypothetical protein
VPVKSLVFKGLDTALISGEEHHLQRVGGFILAMLN